MRPTPFACAFGVLALIVAGVVLALMTAVWVADRVCNLSPNWRGWSDRL